MPSTNARWPHGPRSFESPKSLESLESWKSFIRLVTDHSSLVTYKDIASLAAAYAFGIAKNHPFLDGNKRTAFAAADLFLYFNGLSVEAEQEEIIQLVMMVAAGEIDEAGAAAFFRDHTVKLED